MWFWLIVENYFQKMLSPLSPWKNPLSLKKFKKCKSSCLLANITHFSAQPTPPLPPPSAERVGEHRELAFLLLVVLFSITDLDVIYFLRKIYPPSEVLEVWCIYFYLQCFLMAKFPQWEGGKSWVIGIWKGVILTTWIFFKARNNIL